MRFIVGIHHMTMTTGGEGVDRRDDVTGTTVTSSSTTGNNNSIPLLEWLPPELIETSVLTRFCDATSLANLAHALSMVMMKKGRTSEGGNSTVGGDPLNQSGLVPEQRQGMATAAFQSIVEKSVTARERALLDYEVKGPSPATTRTPSTTTAPYYYYSEVLQIGDAHHVRGTNEDVEENDDVHHHHGEGSDGDPYPIYRRLMILEYCERLPTNMLWCGRMFFRDPSRPSFPSSGQLVQVMLLAYPPLSSMAAFPSTRSSTSWSMEHVCAWNAMSQRSAVAAVGARPYSGVYSNNHSIPGQRQPYLPICMDSYRFLPVGPRGWLCGVTSTDRQALQRIGDHLEKTDHVGTLHHPLGRQSCDSSASFILRVVTRLGARRRLESAGRPTEGVETDGSDNNSRHLLLCFWESNNVDRDDDDAGTITPAQKLAAIRDNLMEYKSFSN